MPARTLDCPTPVPRLRAPPGWGRPRCSARKDGRPAGRHREPAPGLLTIPLTIGEKTEQVGGRDAHGVVRVDAQQRVVSRLPLLPQQLHFGEAEQRAAVGIERERALEELLREWEIDWRGGIQRGMHERDLHERA